MDLLAGFAAADDWKLAVNVPRLNRNSLRHCDDGLIQSLIIDVSEAGVAYLLVEGVVHGVVQDDLPVASSLCLLPGLLLLLEPTLIPKECLLLIN